MKSKNIPWTPEEESYLEYIANQQYLILDYPEVQEAINNNFNNNRSIKAIKNRIAKIMLSHFR